MFPMHRLRRRGSEILGLTNSRWSKRPAGLYVFTFHRIGDAEKADFDPNVFSCSASGFTDVVEFIKREFDVLDLGDVREQQTKSKAAPHCAPRAALITFDDGYVDNFETAVPLLRELDVPATFFISVSMANGVLPWWDVVAYWVRRSTTGTLRLNGTQIDLSQNRDAAIRPILRAFKHETDNLDLKLERYRELLAPAGDPPSGRITMNWEQIQQVANSGFSVASHTMTHPILAHLDEGEQRRELAESKSVLEEQLGRSINSVAFPVGGDDTFSQVTMDLAKESGYEFAFTSLPGINRWGQFNDHRLHRISVDSGNIADLRYRIGKLI
ncbi:MAG: polysaccharide deacetylase family protein [Pseudomonadota bacterium]